MGFVEPCHICNATLENTYNNWRRSTWELQIQNKIKRMIQGNLVIRSEIDISRLFSSTLEIKKREHKNNVS